MATSLSLRASPEAHEDSQPSTIKESRRWRVIKCRKCTSDRKRCLYNGKALEHISAWTEGMFCDRCSSNAKFRSTCSEESPRKGTKDASYRHRGVIQVHQLDLLETTNTIPLSHLPAGGEYASPNYRPALGHGHGSTSTTLPRTEHSSKSNISTSAANRMPFYKLRPSSIVATDASIAPNPTFGVYSQNSDFSSQLMEAVQQRNHPPKICFPATTPSFDQADDQTQSVYCQQATPTSGIVAPDPASDNTDMATFSDTSTMTQDNNAVGDSIPRDSSLPPFSDAGYYSQPQEVVGVHQQDYSLAPQTPISYSRESNRYTSNYQSSNHDRPPGENQKPRRGNEDSRATEGSEIFQLKESSESLDGLRSDQDLYCETPFELCLSQYISGTASGPTRIATERGSDHGHKPYYPVNATHRICEPVEASLERLRVAIYSHLHQLNHQGRPEDIHTTLASIDRLSRDLAPEHSEPLRQRHNQVRAESQNARRNPGAGVARTSRRRTSSHRPPYSTQRYNSARTDTSLPISSNHTGREGTDFLMNLAIPELRGGSGNLTTSAYESNYEPQANFLDTTGYNTKY